MKKIFAKELAALAVLAIAFTGCNTAFDGTNANFSEKESAYTDRSGAAQSPLSVGNATVNGAGIVNTNKKNVIDVVITSFSKINIESADSAIHFQQLTNNATSGYYPTRGADLTKTRIKVNEVTVNTNTFTTTITYEVDGSGVTANSVAFFVDATKLKTKGGTPVLARDNNLTRGELSDSVIEYMNVTGTGITTTITGNEVFAPTYEPIGTVSTSLIQSSGKYTGVRRIEIAAVNKAKPGDAVDYEAGLAEKLSSNFVLQYREPTSRTYKEEKLSFTYHDAAQTTAGDTWGAHSYTADIKALPIGTQYQVVATIPEGIATPDWYTTVSGHKAAIGYTVSGTTYREGAKVVMTNGTYTLHSSVPTYIVQTTGVTTGPDASSSYNPTNYYKTSTGTTIADAQDYFLAVTNTDNWFEVRATNGVKLNPTACSDFILVDNHNKKIASEVQVITKSYNDSTPGNGDVDYVKILIKDVRYRNYNSLGASEKNLSVAVGKGTKIVENKIYPSQVTFGIWEDVADDDLSGYCKIQ